MDKNPNPKYLKWLPQGAFSATVVVAILWLTLAPKPLPDTDIRWFEGIDKAVHACMFGGLVFALTFDCRLRRIRKGRKPRVRLATRLLFFVVSAALGGLVEVAQDAMSIGRGGDWADFLADCAGALLAVVVSPPILRLLLPEPRLPERP